MLCFSEMAKRKRTQTKTKTPRRVSTRKRTRTTKGIYYDEHLDDDNFPEEGKLDNEPVTQIQGDTETVDITAEDNEDCTTLVGEISSGTTEENDEGDAPTTLSEPKETPIPPLDSHELLNLTTSTPSIACDKTFVGRRELPGVVRQPLSLKDELSWLHHCLKLQRTMTVILHRFLKVL